MKEMEMNNENAPKNTNDLTARLRKRAAAWMPEWATASDHWYDNGGRQARDDAALAREAADLIDGLSGNVVRLTDKLNSATEVAAEAVRHHEAVVRELDAAAEREAALREALDTFRRLLEAIDVHPARRLLAEEAPDE